MSRCPGPCWTLAEESETRSVGWSSQISTCPKVKQVYLQMWTMWIPFRTGLHQTATQSSCVVVQTAHADESGRGPRLPGPMPARAVAEACTSSVALASRRSKASVSRTSQGATTWEPGRRIRQAHVQHSVGLLLASLSRMHPSVILVDAAKVPKSVGKGRND